MSLRLSILNLNVFPVLHWDVTLFILMFILSQSDMLIFVMVIDRQTEACTLVPEEWGRFG